METIFYSFKDVIEAKNFSASELAKAFNNYYVSPEDFKKFIEKHGDNDKLFIDLLVKLWDSYVETDFFQLFSEKDNGNEKRDKSILAIFEDLKSLNELPSVINTLTLTISDTGLVRFFKLSAKLCNEYKNIEIGKNVIDTKKYFCDLFARLPEKYIDFKSCLVDGGKVLESEVDEKIVLGCSFILFVVEDLDLGKNNYFTRFLDLLPIKSQNNENKYLLDFLANTFLKMYLACVDTRKANEELRSCDSNDFLCLSAFLPFISLHQAIKRNAIKNSYYQKDKRFIDLVESLKKIYGTQNLINSLYVNHDGDLLKFISDMFKNIKEPKEKNDEADEIKIRILARLLFLGIDEASRNGYRFNILNWFFEFGNEELFKRVCDAIGGSDQFEILGSSTAFSVFINIVLDLDNGSKADELKDVICVGLNFIFQTSCLLNHMNDKNFKRFFCLDKEFSFSLKFKLALVWDYFSRTNKESAFEKLFSYDFASVVAFLAAGAFLKSVPFPYKYELQIKEISPQLPTENFALKKYISSLKTDSEETQRLIDFVYKVAGQTESEKDEDKEKIANFLFDFLAGLNKQCFGGLTNKKDRDSIFSAIKTAKKSDTKPRYEEIEIGCTII